MLANVPLMLSLAGATARQRFLRGWVTGIVMTLGMQYWLAGTLVRMSGFSWTWAVVGLFVYSLFVGLQWAVFAWLYTPVRRWSGRNGWLIAVPLLYTGIEHFFPVVFPFSVGHALTDMPVLLQTIEWFGMPGPATLILVTSCVLVGLCEELLRRRAGVLFTPTAVTALWMVVVAVGVARVDNIRHAPVRHSTSVALVQPNVTVEEKRAHDRTVREGVFERTVGLTRDALGTGPSLVVWPEGGFPFYFDDRSAAAVGDATSRPQKYTKRLQQLSMDVGVDMVVGALRKQDDSTRNSAVFVPRSGLAPTVYDKRRLLVFGERVPLADTFPSLADAVQGTSHYVPGERSVSFEVDGLRWIPGICYESIFAEFTRDALNERDGDVLLNLTNDVWFGDTAAAEQHLMLQIPRTIEDRIWLVRSTNSGISAFVSPTGTVVARTEIGTSVVLYGDMAIPDTAPTLFRRVGHTIPYLSWMALVVLLGVRRWRFHRVGTSKP